MHITTLIHWLNETAFSAYLRQNDIAFPLIEATHLIALGVSVGLVLWIDFRLLGFALEREPASRVITRLEPLALGGYLLMVASGVLLFLSRPETYAALTTFRCKLVLLLLAGANVWFFHRSVLPNIATWDQARRVPWQARFVGGASILVWAGVAVLGRWTAYFADPLYSFSQ